MGVFEKRSDDDDESDKHLEARDRRYSCLKAYVNHLHSIFEGLHSGKTFHIIDYLNV